MPRSDKLLNTMGAWPDAGADIKGRRPSSNYRVRFRHGVYPNAEGQATRADIKKYDYFFSSGQTWVRTPGDGMSPSPHLVNMLLMRYTVGFVDESAQIAAGLQLAEDGRPGETSRRPSRRLLRTKTAERIPLAMSRDRVEVIDTRSRPAAHVTLGTASSSGAPSIASSSPRHAVFQHHRHASPATSTISSLEDSSLIDWQHDAPVWSEPSQLMQNTRTPWPLLDPIEAHIFRYFVNSVAPTWDTTSSHSVFQKKVPQLALSNPILLNAILMLASQHICQANASFPAKPLVYHDRVLQGLIPYLADHGRIKDEGTLVAALLLRAFEEFYGAYKSFLVPKKCLLLTLTRHSWNPWSNPSLNPCDFLWS
jgi:hypothetical protein